MSHACGNISVMPECSNQRTSEHIYIYICILEVSKHIATGYLEREKERKKERKKEREKERKGEREKERKREINQ